MPTLHDSMDGGGRETQEAEAEEQKVGHNATEISF
jgi:hypothetical protein